MARLPAACVVQGKPVYLRDRAARRRSTPKGRPRSPTTADSTSVATLLETAILSARAAASANSAEALQFSVYETVLPYSVPAVMQALRLKYRPPNDPLNPSIKEARVLADVKATADNVSSAFSHVPQVCAVLKAVLNEHDPQHEAALLTRQIRSGVARWVPSVLRWMLPADSIGILETTAYLPEHLVLYSTLANIELVTLGSFQDQALYTPCENQPGHTRYRSWLVVKSQSSLGNRAMSLFADPRGEPPKADAIFASHVKVLLARLEEAASSGTSL